MSGANMAETQIFHDAASDRGFRAKWWTGRLAVYGLLLLWALICLFPIYWTLTTSFKMAPDVMKGHMVPWVDFTPKWLGWKSLGLSPDTWGDESTVRAEFFKRFANSAIAALASSVLAVVLGSLAAYGLSRFSYKFAWMRNADRNGTGSGANSSPRMMRSRQPGNHRRSAWSLVITGWWNPDDRNNGDEHRAA